MSAPPQPVARRQSKRRQIELGLGGAATAIAIVFGIVNAGDVTVDWIVTSSQTPLIIVIAVSFLLGAVAGVLLARRRAGR